MSKQSSVLANVGVLLGAMVLGISVGMAEPTKSGSSRPMGEKMAMQEKMATEKETGMTEEKTGMEEKMQMKDKTGMQKEAGMTEEKMGMEKSESMTETGHMKMDKDQMKGATPMGDTKR